MLYLHYVYYKRYGHGRVIFFIRLHLSFKCIKLTILCSFFYHYFANGKI